MKRVNYIFNISTNMDEDVDIDFLHKANEQLHKLLSDYQRPVENIETNANGKVNVSIDVSETEFDDFGYICFFGYLICDDNIEQVGISDNIYDWFSNELIKISESIIKAHIIKVDAEEYLKITLSEIKDKDNLDGCIDDIDEYIE